MAKFLRDHESPHATKAGVLALAVHLALLGAMLISINWKAAHPVLNVTEVELWDKLPSKAAPPPKPEPKPEPQIKPEPEVKPEPKVEPPPEPKVEDKAQDKAEIALEKQKQQQAEQALEEKRKKEQLEKIKQEAREEELRTEKLAAKQEAQRQKEALKKLQAEMLQDENAQSDKQASAASASEVAAYTEKIKAKIRGNVNKTLCGDGNPELRFEISVLPTGELSGNPKLIKSSGNGACDEAVERAIIASEPLPLPSDPALVSRFRNMNLKFRPND